jgi:HAD superfamily hydrolase (TIGR01509 family)
MLTILWDNDGVLVDTEGLYFRACQQVLGSIGIPLSLDQFKDVSLRQGKSTFVLATDGGVPADEVALLQQQRDKIYEDLLHAHRTAIDGVEEVLHALSGQVRMGVVTSARRRHFEAAHAQSGLIQYLDFVLTREDYERTKPHPEPYLTAMQRHNLRSDECLIVEDSERGLAAAKAARVDCIIVLSQWTRHGNFQGALTVVESIAEVADVIRRRLPSE